MTRHPIFNYVRAVLDDARFRNSRAELAKHVEAITREAAAELAERIEQGQLSALTHKAVPAAILSRFARKNLSWWQRCNPLAQRIMKQAAAAGVRAALVYLQARFPVVTLVNASGVVAILRDITAEGSK